MIQKMTIPYAMADFNRLRIEGNYYVDKTMYIPSLEKYSSPVYLRPRRFGKSLLCSTLYYYYDRTQASRFQELFGSTWIGKNPTEKQGQMIVIRFDFSALAVCDDMMELERRFNILNAGSIDVAAYHNRDIFKDFAFSDGKNASNAKRRVESPESVSAVIHAHAPGSEVTGIPASRHFFTNISPGSDMAGVPASVIIAISFPSCILSTSSSALSNLLNS